MIFKVVIHSNDLHHCDRNLIENFIKFKKNSSNYKDIILNKLFDCCNDFQFDDNFKRFFRSINFAKNDILRRQTMRMTIKHEIQDA